MKSSLLLAILFLVFACSPIPRNDEQDPSSFEPFSILSVESNLVEIKYVTTGLTKSIPPHIMRREDSYICELVFRLSLKNEIETWSDPVYVTIEGTDKAVELLYCNEELSLLTDSISPEYVMQLEVKNKGDISVTLGYLDAQGKVVFNKANPFHTKIVTLK